MMTLFDSHCHLADSAFDDDRAQALERMKAAGLAHALVICDPCEEGNGYANTLSLLEENQWLYGAIGVHPQNALNFGPDAISAIKGRLSSPRFVCLGEIGLDFHYPDPPRDVQMDAFLAQLELAKELNVCAQLHIRDAHGALMDVIRPMHRQGRLPRCILHCYSGSWEMAKEYLDMGMYISVSGVVTFKNAQKLKEVAQNLPADRILVETDCPYMAPVPLRGKRNEPAFVEHTARCVAQLRGADEEQFSLQLCENTKAALGIG